MKNGENGCSVDNMTSLIYAMILSRKAFFNSRSSPCPPWFTNSFPQILTQALNAFGKHGDRLRIREAHVLPGAVVPEIESGRDGDAGFLEHVPAEAVAVGREPFAVRIDIERAFGRGRNVEAEAAQFRQQEVALFAECVAPFLEQRDRVRMKRGKRGLLRQVRRRNEQVLRQFVDRGDVWLGRNHPAQAPSGHAEIFGEAVDDEYIVGELQRAA